MLKLLRSNKTKRFNLFGLTYQQMKKIISIIRCTIFKFMFKNNAIKYTESCDASGKRYMQLLLLSNHSVCILDFTSDDLKDKEYNMKETEFISFNIN